jgi:hypothetical protein
MMKPFYAKNAISPTVNPSDALPSPRHLPSSTSKTNQKAKSRLLSFLLNSRNASRPLLRGVTTSSSTPLGVASRPLLPVLIVATSFVAPTPVHRIHSYAPITRPAVKNAGLFLLPQASVSARPTSVRPVAHGDSANVVLVSNTSKMK